MRHLDDVILLECQLCLGAGVEIIECPAVPGEDRLPGPSSCPSPDLPGHLGKIRR